LIRIQPDHAGLVRAVVDREQQLVLGRELAVAVGVEVHRDLRADDRDLQQVDLADGVGLLAGCENGDMAGALACGDPDEPRPDEAAVTTLRVRRDVAGQPDGVVVGRVLVPKDDAKRVVVVVSKPHAIDVVGPVELTAHQHVVGGLRVDALVVALRVDGKIAPSAAAAAVVGLGRDAAVEHRGPRVRAVLGRPRRSVGVAEAVLIEVVFEQDLRVR